MLFMLESKARPGVSHDQLIAYFNRSNLEAWELIRRGAVKNLLFKTVNDIGFFAVLSAPSPEEAARLVERTTRNNFLFDVRVIPVREFARFDDATSATVNAAQTATA